MGGDPAAAGPFLVEEPEKGAASQVKLYGLAASKARCAKNDQKLTEKKSLTKEDQIRTPCVHCAVAGCSKEAVNRTHVV